MGSPDLSCPVCQADLPVAGDEPAGAEVFCHYCGAPAKLTKAADDEECKVEEDF